MDEKISELGDIVVDYQEGAHGATPLTIRSKGVDDTNKVVKCILPLYIGQYVCGIRQCTGDIFIIFTVGCRARDLLCKFDFSSLTFTVLFSLRVSVMYAVFPGNLLCFWYYKDNRKVLRLVTRDLKNGAKIMNSVDFRDEKGWAQDTCLLPNYNKMTLRLKNCVYSILTGETKTGLISPFFFPFEGVHLPYVCAKFQTQIKHTEGKFPHTEEIRNTFAIDSEILLVILKNGCFQKWILVAGTLHLQKQRNLSLRDIGWPTTCYLIDRCILLHCASESGSLFSSTDWSQGWIALNVDTLEIQRGFSLPKGSKYSPSLLFPFKEWRELRPKYFVELLQIPVLGVPCIISIVLNYAEITRKILFGCNSITCRMHLKDLKQQSYMFFYSSISRCVA